jgi:hypothetical protein
MAFAYLSANTADLVNLKSNSFVANTFSASSINADTANIQTTTVNSASIQTATIDSATIANLKEGKTSIIKGYLNKTNDQGVTIAELMNNFVLYNDATAGSINICGEPAATIISTLGIAVNEEKVVRMGVNVNSAGTFSLRFSGIGVLNFPNNPPVTSHPKQARIVNISTPGIPGVAVVYEAY